MTTTIDTTVGAYRKKVSSVWGRCGVFTRDLSNFSGLGRDAADRVGFKAVAVMLDGTANVDGNVKELLALRPEFNRKGWKVVGWATAGQGTPALDAAQVTAQGVKHRQLLRTYALDGWICNIESWGEGTRAWVSAAWMQGWMQGQSDQPPLMLSCLSSTTSNFGRSMDYLPFVTYPKCAISPQVYSASNPDHTLISMRGSFSLTTVPLDRIGPTCNVVKGKPVPTRYKRWQRTRWLWTGEDVVNPADFARVLVPGACS